MFHSDEFAQSLAKNRMNRRQVLWLFGASTAATTLASLQGCAKSPVTGQSILVGMSEAQERAVDAQVSPNQFSQDLGAIQDEPINQYVSQLGQKMHQLSHRPDMPYNYRVLNANYVNAYTFPGGAMGLTRAIMLEMDNEAQLAALLGHELGHVNARHAAQRQGAALVTQVAVIGVNVAASSSKWGGLVGIGSQVGASALLSKYSRDNEREADFLGQQYMVKSGYPASGMTELHAMLMRQGHAKPDLLSTMFSSHPMSDERHATADKLAKSTYASSLGQNPQRERYMDSITGLRNIKNTVVYCQRGEAMMANKKPDAAQAEFTNAIKLTPQDYASNLRMAQALQALGKETEAQQFAGNAQRIYPKEAQAHKLGATLHLALRQPDRAYESLNRYDQLLPGDAGILFLKGISLEGMGKREPAAQHYNAFLKQSNQGEAAQYALSRLQAWGYTK